MRQLFPPNNDDLQEKGASYCEEEANRIKNTVKRYLPKKYKHLTNFIYENTLSTYKQTEFIYHNLSFNELLYLQINLLKELENET